MTAADDDQVEVDPWVARGPTTGTDWCVLPEPPAGCLAPGGVVLCREGSQTPHPDAQRAAESARVILDRWQRTQRVIEVELPRNAPGPRRPAPPLAPQWRQPERREP